MVHLYYIHRGRTGALDSTDILIVAERGAILFRISVVLWSRSPGKSPVLNFGDVIGGTNVLDMTKVCSQLN